MNGEIFFNMIERQHPLSGSSSFLMKRWKKYTIYTKEGPYVKTRYLKSGSYGWTGKENTIVDANTDIAYNRTNDRQNGVYYEEPSNILDNKYQTGSVWLYDYVVVSQDFYYKYVYTESVENQDPSVEDDYVEGSNPPLWKHEAGTWKNSPNSIYSNYIGYKTKTGNNYIYPINTFLTAAYGRRVYGYVEGFKEDDEEYTQRMKTPRFSSDECYFEIIKGYPRNHYSHKRHLFSLYSYNTIGKLRKNYDGTISFEEGVYIRNQQTTKTTVGQDSLEDGTPPVQSFQVGNLKYVQTDNVIN